MAAVPLFWRAIMKLLTINEVSQEIRISPATIRRLIKKQQIPFRRVGHRQFFTPDDIALYLENCIVPAREFPNKGGSL